MPPFLLAWFARGKVILAALTGLALTILGVVLFRAGENKQKRKADKARIEALEDQIEMGREADEIENDVEAMNRDELEKEATKWSKG